MKKFIIIFSTVLYFSSCNTVKDVSIIEVADEKELTTEQLEFPLLLNSHNKQFEAQSLVNGVLEEIKTDELGMLKLVISTELNYYFLDEIRTFKYYLVYGGMEKIFMNIGDQILIGDKLGLASSRNYLTSYSDNLDNYALRMSNANPKNYNNYWYFEPDWLLNGNTAWLTFRPVSNFKNALIGYYNRWVLEDKKPEGLQIHHDNSLDRIRFHIKLNSYPIITTRDDGIKLVEKVYYESQEIFVLKNVYDEFKIGDFNIVIYWQKQFDTYLTDEYKLGDEMYIYGSIYAIDFNNKNILVYVRDFSLDSDEKIIEDKRIYNNPN